MHTPALDQGIVRRSVTVILVTVCVLDIVLYAGVRASLTAGIDRLLDERSALAVAEGRERSGAALAGRLAALGIRATVTSPDGRFGADPQAPAVDLGVSSPAAESGSAFARRRVDLPDGDQVVVYTRRAGVDDALGKVVVFEALGLLLAAAVATLLLRRSTTAVLRPLDEMAASARRTSSGQVGERLRPDEPDTSLGHLATAYDEMLDALERAVADARASQGRSERLYEEASRLAAIVESAQDAMFSESLDGRILTWNTGASVLYGFAADEIIGQPAAMLVPADGRAEAESFLQYAREGRSVPTFETTRVTRGGVTLDVAVTLSPVPDEAGNVIALSTIARDLTEHRWLAATLNSTLARLEEALLEARAAEERSRRFLSDAAHQLRSPIAGVQACAETLLRGPPVHERDTLLAGLVGESARASRLISSLLLLARVDEGRPLASDPADVVELCHKELDRIRLVAPGLVLELHSPSGQAHTVPGRDSVREIVANVLDNARRHAVRAIHVTVTRTGGVVNVCIGNDGPPVAPELRERMFERFVGFDSGGGSGLGLSIARELARAHGGDLVWRQEGFVLTLPGVRNGAVGPGSPVPRQQAPAQHVQQ